MKTLHPAAKVGLVVLGLVIAVAIGWVAVELRDRFSPVPAVEKAGGMYAFGDLLLGVAVSGVVALVPLALGFYWLRPVAMFWRGLTWFGAGWAVAGFVALAINHWAVPPLGYWALFGIMRFGLMPLAALGFLSAAVFAPQPRDRWRLAGIAVLDGLVFTAVVVGKFVLR